MAEEDKKKKQSKKDEPVSVAKTPAELQRMKLEKLMKNPAKPVYIPDSSKEAKMKEPPEFIRNVWGSSAGAGSGDFHVYRGVRRREYARQKFITEMAAKKAAETEYHKRMEEHKKAADEKTAKKRAKRQKKKQKMKGKKAKKDIKEGNKTDSEEEEEDENKDSNEKLEQGQNNTDSNDSGNTENEKTRKEI